MDYQAFAGSWAPHFVGTAAGLQDDFYFVKRSWGPKEVGRDNLIFDHSLHVVKRMVSGSKISFRLHGGKAVRVTHESTNIGPPRTGFHRNICCAVDRPL